MAPRKVGEKRPPDSPSRLMRAYEQAVYTAELPAGCVEFRMHTRPAGPVPDSTLAIVTAWNPGTKRPSATENRKANDRLHAVLCAGSRLFYPASGRSADGTHVEPSFAVLGIDAESALALARQFNQAAILYWDGAVTRLLWCDG